MLLSLLFGVLKIPVVQNNNLRFLRRATVISPPVRSSALYAQLRWTSGKTLNLRKWRQEETESFACFSNSRMTTIPTGHCRRNTTAKLLRSLETRWKMYTWAVFVTKNRFLDYCCYCYQKQQQLLISLQFTVLIHSLCNTGSHFGRREGVVDWDVSC